MIKGLWHALLTRSYAIVRILLFFRRPKIVDNVLLTVIVIGVMAIDTDSVTVKFDVQAVSCCCWQVWREPITDCVWWIRSRQNSVGQVCHALLCNGLWCWNWDSDWEACASIKPNHGGKQMQAQTICFVTWAYSYQLPAVFERIAYRQ